MKTQFFLISLGIVIFSSCTTTKEGCYTNAKSLANSRFEVAAIPAINLKGAASTPNVLRDNSGQVTNVSVILIKEIKQTAFYNPNEQVLLARAPVQNEGSVLTAEQLKTRMAAELRTVARSTESRFAGRVLNRIARKIESKDFRAKEKVTFSDKLKMKVFAKMQAKYGREGGMSTADILSIVSLSTGVVAFAAYYASFLFGLAAIITGAIALRNGTSRRGMAIAGIVLGAVAIFFWSGWFLFY